MPTDRLARYLERKAARAEQAPVAGSWEDYLTGKCRSLSKRVEKKIGQSPALSVGVALAVGVFVGWMIKRR